jgi:hypothetical protein
MKADEIAALRDSESPFAACLESKSSNNQDKGICQCISTDREAEIVTVSINTPKCRSGCPRRGVPSQRSKQEFLGAAQSLNRKLGVFDGRPYR